MDARETIRNHFEQRWREFYERYTSLPEAHNGNCKILSPFRQETEPSLQIDFEGKFAGRWQDFGSGEGGDLFDFYARLHDLDVKRDFAAVLEGIARDFGVQIDSGSNGRTGPKLKHVRVDREKFFEALENGEVQ